MFQVSRAFWPVGMSKAHRLAEIHRQTNRVSGGDVVTGRAAGRTSLDNELFKKVTLITRDA